MKRTIAVCWIWLACFEASCIVSTDSLEESPHRPAEVCRCPKQRSEVDRAAQRFQDTEGPRGAVRIRIQHEPSTMLSLIDADPLIRGIVDHDVLETLVRVSEDGRAIEPELAEHFESDDARLTYTFRIAEEARWHDGIPVTSFDVEFVLSKLMDPFGNLTSMWLSHVEEVSIPDDRTIVIKLDRPAPDFLYAISTVTILPEHVFGRTPLALHEAARAPIGSGPFRFVRWEPSRIIELERDLDWRGEAPRIDRIVYRLVPDDRIAVDMFRQGELDVIPGLPADTLIDIPQARLITSPQPYVEAWLYNTKNNLLFEKASRLAIGHLIDRETIRCSILKCGADVVTDPWLTANSELTDAPILAFDKASAVSILSRAGWRDSDNDGVLDRGKESFSFSFLLPDQRRDVDLAAVVAQGDLADVGIDMKIVKLSRGAYLRRLKDGDFDVAGLSITARPMFDAWSLLHSGAVGVLDNFGSFRDAVMDEHLDKLVLTNDMDERISTMSRISGRIRELQPLTFTFRPYLATLARISLGGVSVRDGWLEERRLFIIGENP